MKKAGGWRSGKRFCDRPSRSKPYRRTVQDFSFSKPFTGLEKTRRCDRRSVLSGQRGERDKRGQWQDGHHPARAREKRQSLTAFPASGAACPGNGIPARRWQARPRLPPSPLSAGKTVLRGKCTHPVQRPFFVRKTPCTVSLSGFPQTLAFGGSVPFTSRLWPVRA